MKIWNIFSFFILLLIFHGCNSQVPFSDVNFKDDITKTIDIHVKYEEFGYIYIGLEKTIYLETDFNDTETSKIEFELVIKIFEIITLILLILKKKLHLILISYFIL